MEKRVFSYDNFFFNLNNNEHIVSISGPWIATINVWFDRGRRCVSVNELDWFCDERAEHWLVDFVSAGQPTARKSRYTKRMQLNAKTTIYVLLYLFFLFFFFDFSLSININKVAPSEYMHCLVPHGTDINIAFTPLNSNL